jgi:uncharacterized secreted protein with C-terminal beta-propeller domain
MAFLINNPLILLGGIVVLGFMIFMGTKIVNEIKLNQLLRTKHQAMRVAGTGYSFAKRIGFLTSTALAPIAVIAIVFTVGLSNTITPTGNLQDIRNADDILNIYEEFQENMSSYDTWRGWFAMGDAVDMEMDGGVPSADDGNNGGDQGSDDYSETNNQVQGVDEMDNVITDGKYIYTLQYNQVFITLAYTQSQGASALSNYKVIDYIDDETECPSGMYVTGLYVDDNYLVVIGSEYEYYCDVKEGDDTTEPYYYDYWYGYNNNVKVYVYDKTEDFELISEYDLAGNLIGTRKIGDNVYVITNTWMPLYDESIDVDEYLPYYAINIEETLAEYGDVVYVEGTNPNSFTTFYALDLDNEEVDMEVLLGDSGYNLYVSPNNIYLVGNIYYFVPMAEFLDVEEPVAETKTAIQKISINDADLEYVTTGTVSGYTLNQFSMDEKDGYLRIATTTGWWGEDINNRVFVLDENLEEVSRLEHLGKPGETIRSVRFVGDYGYVVTFEQTDPFYVINLSDPDNPFTEGELEIPGFSTYLQPLNDNYMLGIGFGDSDGGTNGLKISVYDISDKTNPVVFDEVIFDYEDFGWSWSSATYNHKDILIDMGKGIIALPFSTYDWSQSEGYSYNSGVLVYNFDETDGLEEAGFITHDQNTDEEVYVYKIKFIDQYFYTISNKYIKASLISDPEIITNAVTLPEYNYGSDVLED